MKTKNLDVSATAEGTTLNPSECVEYLVSLYQTGNFHRAPLLRGSPGSGKTSLVKQVVTRLREIIPDFGYEEMNPTMPADEVGGIPDLIRKEGHATRTDYAMPVWFARIMENPNWQGIVCLDDGLQGDKYMQQTLANLILARNLRGHALPKGAMIVVTGNRKEDKAGVGTMLTHLGDRMCHINVKTDAASWLENFAIPKNLDERVQAYIRWDGSRLDRFDPSVEKSPTARTWEAVSDHMKFFDKFAKPEQLAIKPKLMSAVLSGELGVGEAARFTAFCGRYAELPDLLEVLANPSTFKVDYDLDVQYAIAMALAQRMNANTFPAALEYINRMGPEFVTLAVQVGTKGQPQLTECAAWGKWVLENQSTWMAS